MQYHINLIHSHIFNIKYSYTTLSFQIKKYNSKEIKYSINNFVNNLM